MVMPYTAIQFTVLHKLKSLAAGSSKSGLLFFSRTDSSFGIFILITYCSFRFLVFFLVSYIFSRYSLFWCSHVLSTNSLCHAEYIIHISPYLSYISGAAAGCAATVGSYPFDLVRTLLASQGEPKVFDATSL